MDELTAFERQISGELGHEIGPTPSFDAMAIARAAAIQSPKWRFQSMFSATKVVVAGVIVALFGGFLLSGVLTQPSEESAPAVGASASASPEAPPSSDAAMNYAAVRSQLITEQLRPGVLRVVRDGAGHEFAANRPHSVSIAADGSVWMLGISGLVELGEPGSHDPDGYKDPYGGLREMEFGPDGTLWALTNNGLWRWPESEFAEGAWAGAPLVALAALEVLGDGTVWARSAEAFARLDEDGWTTFPFADAPINLPDHDDFVATVDFASTPDGAVWASVEDSSSPHSATLVRFDGTSWESMEPLGPGRPFRFDALASGSDGALWVALRGCDDSDCGSGDRGDGQPFLARFDGGVWSVLGADDGVQPVGVHRLWGGDMEVSEDGKILATTAGAPDEYRLTLSLFDSNGKLATLRDITALLGSDSVASMVAAPDGSFWVTTWDNQVGGAFIIEPDALLDDTATTPDLLPGVDLVTEEVEPGVFRVLSDGTDNDMGLQASWPNGSTQVIAGQDGSVWVRDWSMDAYLEGSPNADRLFRLGLAGSIDASGLGERDSDISVAPDGTFWGLLRDGRLRSLADGEWTRHPGPEGVLVTGIETPADGSVWTTWAVTNPEMASRLSVARLVDGKWHEQPVEPAMRAGDGGSLAIGPDGTTLLGATYYHSAPTGYPWAGPLELAGDRWVPSLTVELDESRRHLGFGPIVIGEDGTAWAYTPGYGETEPWGPRLLRRTDGDWETLGDDESVPMLVGGQMWESSVTVSDDGRLWIAFEQPVALAWHREEGGNKSVLGTLDGGCAGVLSFDGATWGQHLAGACATHVSTAPNGNVWVTVVELDPVWVEGDPERTLDPARAPAGVYVITPEAVAATE